MMGMGWIRACAGLLAAASLALPLSAPAAETSPEAAVNIAGRQRMLAQRVVKAYCQLGLEVMPDISREQLDGAVREFGARLGELERLAPDAATRKALAELGRRWAPLRRAALGKVSKAGARRLVRLGDAVLASADTVTTRFEAGAPHVGRLVNVSGRQRMLSQRLAKLFMLRAWGIEDRGARADMDATKKQFSDGLAALRAAPVNTPVIAQELDEVALQWDWFQNALALDNPAAYLLLVADASESILQAMERITERYVQLEGSK